MIALVDGDMMKYHRKDLQKLVEGFNIGYLGILDKIIVIAFDDSPAGVAGARLQPERDPNHHSHHQLHSFESIQIKIQQTYRHTLTITTIFLAQLSIGGRLLAEFSEIIASDEVSEMRERRYSPLL